MASILYFLLWAGLFIVMMRFGCGAHVMGHGHHHGNSLADGPKPSSGLAGKLQQAGLIRYSRGRITMLDRRGLEARTCECYQVVKTENDRLLPTLPSSHFRPTHT